MKSYLLNGEPVSLDGIIRDNHLDEDETRQLRELEPGDTFHGGGGAWAEWTVECRERPDWGLPPVGDFAAAWGARAIWGGPGDVIDLLWNRQGAVGDEGGRDMLQRWLNGPGGALAILRKLVDGEMSAKRPLYPDESREVSYAEGPFKIRANPNASHGYLYISATYAPKAKQ